MFINILLVIILNSTKKNSFVSYAFFLALAFSQIAAPSGCIAGYSCMVKLLANKR
jgi:hypothetical protein